ncbi:bifunctional diguanylate cyclase/phosphodiesterase [Asticcacaulis sp. BYS171W]|uniref:Bifunctional diguanylate cyclase/phosphodiesterase n=1 Tax=Asticcacaulis aquaticus TaxID=2984212 RepID=A0ABT5HYR5_9CAUL|nr:bifunctional diguanylate cyclase/phosphodiesterase [Asticcacaulis aquaticus]MDC7685217.1 bifunctional diguanylate cyclase/phosphodiesterase [Asticcacaulis aquaticus]
MKVSPKSDGTGARAAGLVMGALDAAGQVAWRYDLMRARFELSGKLAHIDLSGGKERVGLSDLAAHFDVREMETLSAALKQAASGQAVKGSELEAGELRCLLTTRSKRLLCFRGRRSASAGNILGTLCDLTEEVKRLMNADTTEDYGEFNVHDLHIDPLTGLYNRQGFLKAAQVMLRLPGDYDLVVGDLNRFRRLNEALGHERADLVLSILGQRLREVFDDTAVVARLGEDEFAVLTTRGFPRVSERMRLGMERSISVAGFDIHPTFSMGAVSVEGGEGALDSGELLRRAEMAVEAAQQKGVGGVASYKRDLESDGLTQLALEAELRKAFVSGEIGAWYQPIVDLKTGTIAGFEALARWVHPKRGIVPPDEFLGLARDLGLLCDLSTIMMGSTVKTLGKWRAQYGLPDDFFISVNLSSADIERQHLVEDVSRLIRDHDLPRKALKLEVTESDVMRDPQAAARILESLREAGAGIALDDFGTGFSSLSYLARLPFDTLKIDRSFVITMKTEAASEKIVRSILTLGRDLGLDVVAEGVEDMELAGRLATLGCDFGQGWGYAKALRPPEAEAFMARSLGQTLKGPPLKDNVA